MKKFLKRLKKIDRYELFYLLDKVIEHHFFKPVSIVILTSFILVQGIDYAQNFITDYRESSINKKHSTPITINISASGMNFDIDEEQIAEHRIKSGDTMMKILIEIGANEQDVFAILNAMKKVFSPQGITVGNSVTVKYNVKIAYDVKQPQSTVERKIVINNVTILPSLEEEVVVSRKADGSYEASLLKVKLQRYISKYSGIIKNGLFVDGVNAGISPTSMMNMINLYGYDVDFQRDIHDGDKFEMLVESFYDENGKKIKDGNVLFSSLTLQNRAIDIYMHKVDGKVEYFDSKGNSVRKSLLRTPINGARVSSGFGLRRHPILGYSKMHKGTDFAAPTGTPIMAAGSGTIIWFGPKGAYGNYVQIKHSPDYSTAYGHASRFNRKFRVGAKVKQGDIVAYVGTTGRSTGPHLHFEVLYRGNQINPAKVKATSGIRLSGKELSRFEADKAEIDKYRKNIPNQIR